MKAKQILANLKAVLVMSALWLTGNLVGANIIEGGTVIEGSRERTFRNDGPPLSGTTQGTLAGAAPPGSLLRDVTSNVLYQNEGTLASPYWTPVAYDQRGLMGYFADFRDEVGKALADTAASVVLAGSGIRVFGQGVEVNGDSGLTVAQVAEVGPVATVQATNQAEHLTALSFGDTTAMWQPDTHGPLIIDIECAQLTDLADRAFFVGFLGAVADALDPCVTGSGTTITLVQDDLAGVVMDSGLTDAAGLMLVHNKSNAAASIDTVTDTEVDLAVDVPAAGTYARYRVQIAADGDMTIFKDKVEVGFQAIALDIDEECQPVAYVEAQTTTAKAMTVKTLAMYATRP